ncbi:SUZ RNA-binding domain-containing-like [Tubulanus polymorphus]|uniref:SUZ RNA-binding domain-containing-like n=1 Tax=Tubulanus polymorphus TaxID=672921 RepID=UPI003DA57837
MANSDESFQQNSADICCTNGVDLDSWEDIVDSGELDKRIEQLKVSNERNCNDGEEDESFPREPVMKGAAPILLQEENNRTPYQPQIKLLRRKSGDNGRNQQNNEAKTKPVKSLAERQEEYAKVRERIFGSDNSSSSSGSGGTSSSSNTTNTDTPSTNKPQKSVVVSVNTAKKATVSASTGRVQIQGGKKR